jgi:heptose I phosphotransferase
MKETFWQRLARGVRRVRQRPDWLQFAGPNWVDGIMAAAVTDRFHTKQGRSTGRWIVQVENRRLAVYLKRHYRLPWWRGLLALVWPNRGWSPALQEWRHLQWAQARGLPVPHAVAAAEFIGPWGKLQSFLAVEELVDMLPLHEAIPLAANTLKPKSFQHWKKGLANELARLTRNLHHQHFFHKDLYLCHFFIPQSLIHITPPWRDRVHMIDFHRLSHHRWTWRFWQLKDLGQLVYSSEIPGIDVRDRLRFWRAYLGPEFRARRRRWLRRLVILKWRQYRKHNQKGPLGKKQDPS